VKIGCIDRRGHRWRTRGGGIRHYVADRGYSGVETFLLAQQVWCDLRFIAAGAFGNDQANPIDDADAGVAEGLAQVAEFEVSMGVYEAGEERDVAKIGHVCFAAVRGNVNNSVAFNRDDAVFDWRLIYGVDNAGTERGGHRFIVAEFAAIELPNDAYSAPLWAPAGTGW
jgi:hypothetical protein